MISAALSNVVEIAAGADHNMVRLGDGSPHITVNPYSRPVPAGTNTLLATLAVGVQPLYFQWQRNGVNLAGETNATLLLTQAHLGTVGEYRCIVTNSLGSATGKSAAVSVLFPPPRLTTKLESLPAAGEPFTFTVSNLSGQGPVVIYSSTNLLDWTPIRTNAPGPLVFDFTDHDSLDADTRYYRASEER
jgi:hypothetical protein